MNSQPQAGHDRGVDMLRALAMLSVVGLHSHLLPCGWIGVWLFYVISGYVVTRSVLVRGEAGAGGAVLGGFLRRRSARILPLYMAYVAIGLVVAALLGNLPGAATIASLVLFFNNVAMILGWGRMTAWPTGHLWTLSTEMQFYLLYGAALCLLPVRATRMLLLALLLICPLLRGVAGAELLADGWRPLDAAFAVYAGPGFHFDIFAMGALLALARAEQWPQGRAWRLMVAGAVLLALYAAVYVWVGVAMRGAHGTGALRNILSGILIGEHREIFLYSAVGAAMAGLVAVVAGRHLPVERWPGAAALAWIGAVSYGGYVLHPLCLRLATLALWQIGIDTRGGVAGHVAQFVVGTALTLLLAGLSHRWLEEPARRRLSQSGGSQRWRDVPGKRGVPAPVEVR